MTQAMQTTLNIMTSKQDEWVEITSQVAQTIADAPAPHGLVHLFVPHTTAGITVQENADPPLKDDINLAFSRIFPRHEKWRHCEDNAASHMKTVVTGTSVQVPYAQGKLLLGQWQGIYLCEYDGPRERKVIVTLH